MAPLVHGAPVVLEEEIDKDHDPSEEEIYEYASWLGIDVDVDPDLLWIAISGLKSPLPTDWKPCQTGEDGEIFYYNFSTGESVWEHPCDAHHRDLFRKEYEKKYGRSLSMDPADQSLTASMMDGAGPS